MTLARAWHGWLRRGLLAGVLAVVAFAPVTTSSNPAAGCGSSPCAATTAGTVRWIISLPGSWDASSALPGTVPLAPAYPATSPGTSSPPPGASTLPSSGATPGTGPQTQQVYAAAGPSVVALGFGMIVYGYSARTGHTLWVTGLTGFPAGSRIVSVRVWPAVVAVGVSDGPQPGPGGASQRTVLLTASGGRQLRSYPAAPFGGAVAAPGHDTVVVGPSAVTSYDNATGRVAWSRSTGDDLQSWRSDGGHLYVAQAVGGPMGTGPVTAVRRISLRTGLEQIIYPSGSPYVGRLAAVVRGVVLFASTQGVSAYSGATGQLLWHRADVVPESVDVVRGLFYLAIGSTSTLTGVQAWSGHSVARVTGASGSATGGVYGVRDGVALGLDLGALGEAWGYDVAQQRVIWSTRTLPWPHFFVDLSGIGGSAGSTDPTVLLSACPQRIQTPAGYICQTPELVLINR
ncbi:MAG TPA: hypothetical protein VKS82_24570 [Streptosporangiaceae bacterium]|nr:hypothetical protein [Streptosporangiaceae bacterium]